jgi:hypothetical protein
MEVQPVNPRLSFFLQEAQSAVHAGKFMVRCICSRVPAPNLKRPAQPASAGFRSKYSMVVLEAASPRQRKDD